MNRDTKDARRYTDKVIATQRRCYNEQKLVLKPLITSSINAAMALAVNYLFFCSSFAINIWRMNKLIKIILLNSIFFAVIGIAQVHAQQSHFLYIQSDDKEPFTAAINGKTFVASSIGYIIIPKLQDGNYQLSVRFPKTKFPDQQFSCSINNADAGYALKNFGAKGWGLFNLQSLEITMAGIAAPDVVKTTAKPNGFGDMLSDVTNDTTLNTPLPSTETVSEVKEPVPLKDTLSSKLPVKVQEEKVIAAATVVIAEKQVSKPVVSANKAVQRISEEVTGTGTSIIFVTDGAEGKDTIRIFLEQPQELQIKQADSVVTVTKPADSIAADIKKQTPQPVVDEIKIDDKEVTPGAEVANPFFNPIQQTEVAKEIPADSAIAATNKKVEAVNPVISETFPATVKDACKTMLSEGDFEKLKKRMFATTGNEKMIQAALKSFQGKCVSTAQVKNLSGYFLSDAARYDFFSSAYPYVYDMPEFGSLETQLIDPVYKSRFKSMLK